VNLSLEHGNSDGSCFAYVFFGMIAGPHFDNYKGGFQFGPGSGYALVEKAQSASLSGLERTWRSAVSLCHGRGHVSDGGRDLVTFARFDCRE